MKQGLLFISMLFVILSSCSKNHRDHLIEETLTIVADKSMLQADGIDVVTFAVIDQVQKDVTSEVQIKANGELLQGNTLTTTQDGVYEIVATKGKVVSNTLKITALKKEVKLLLEIDKEVILANGSDKVTFSVKKSDGTDVTTLAQVLVNGITIDGNTYATETPGAYRAKARYDGMETPEVSFRANEVKSINLLVDNVNLVVGEKDVVIFSVKAKSGEDLTDASVIYINDKAIEGYSYKFEQAGSYTAYALHEDVKSNIVAIEVKMPEQYGLSIQATKHTLLADGIDAISLSCLSTLDNGKDVTRDAKFYVNGQELESNYLRTTTAGTFSIVAKYNGYTSNNITITTADKPTLTPHVYVEDFTALWCRFCPRFLFVMEDAAKDPRILPMVLHGGGDRFATRDEDVIGRFLGVSGYPTVIVNRRPHNRLSGSTTSAILSHLPSSTPVGVALEVKEDGSRVRAVAHIYSQDNIDDALCIAMLYENGLVADQSNTVFPELGNPIVNMVHNHVYRTSYYTQKLSGEPIRLKAGVVLKKEFDFEIKPGWNAKNLGVVVLITQKDHSVINGQRADVRGVAGY